MEGLIIRPIEQKDTLGVATVHVKTWQSAYKGLMPDSFLDSLSIELRNIRWQENLKHPAEKTVTLVAEEERKIVGFCSIGKCRDEYMDQETGELYAIYVDKDFSGKGVGSALHQKAIDILKENGFKKATLWVLSTNEKTIKWYKAKGWVADGKTKTEDMGGFAITEARYIINLK